jgi:two-component system OmpR family response regulator
VSRNGDPNSHRILVAEHDPAIAAAVTSALGPAGYELRTAASGRAALDEAAAADPDVIVVDWLLPDMEGIALVHELRARRITPGVLFLAPEDATEKMLQRLGAHDHDYVVRPFSRAEIVARTEAIFRRAGRGLPGEVLQFEDIVVDVARHEVFRGDRRIALTGREFALLRYFVLNARLVLSRRQILENVWQSDPCEGSNVVETYVSYLRKKLNAAGPPVIRTVRQGGYVLEPAASRRET